MKIINSGIKFEIYPNNIKTYDQLPVGSYFVRYNDDDGFYLTSAPTFKAVGEKVYGSREDKVSKVMASYTEMSRSLGVILSGDKGIGKSLFSRMLSIRAFELEMPTIIIDTAYRGIEKFVATIEQECLILFDEFEKVFDGSRGARQEDLLGLFDGVSQQKHLFVVTANEVHKLSEFLLNRPGRFHYHLRFSYPTEEEILEYMSDNVSKEYHSEIAPVIKFSSFIDLNYDCLRAISYELDSGLSFSEAIQDLNIIKTDRFIPVSLAITLKNGVEMHRQCSINSNFELSLDYDHFSSGKASYYVSMDVDLNKSEQKKGCIIVDLNSVGNFGLYQDVRGGQDIRIPFEDIEGIYVTKAPQASLHFKV